MFFLAFTVVEKKSHWSNCSLYLWQSGSGWLAGTTLKTERSSSPSVNRFQRSSVASVSLHGIGCRSEVVFWHVVLVNGESNIFHETLSSVACSFHTVTLGHFDLLSWKWARAIFVRNALGGWITVMWHFDKKMIIHVIIIHYRPWQKPAELAHSILLCPCVRFCLYGPFPLYFIPLISQQLSAFSVFVLPVLFQPFWSFQLYISLWKSPSASDIILCGWLGWKHQSSN